MNLPNRLSMVRIFLIPLIVLIFLFPVAQFNIYIGHFTFGFVTLSYRNVVLLVLFALASFTDFLDGYIARKYDMITSFGKFIDPIADKLLVNTMFILLAWQGIVPIVAVLLMLWRDTAVDAIRMIASSKGRVMAAGYLGKVKTVSQMIAIMLLLVNNLPFELYGLPVADFMVWFATFISLLSGISYFLQAKDILLESK
ncbi:MAG: CDP-diacylglycerol--glycerol-3-phosphate 3-phosphatidyltransferase [Erysipelotrichales bacterium]|nr:MAG: CDP-diacylglycerol--glycerol-3-phosphate 3-phosphatidyltransferase [Erysipelotrichales bacterium]